MKKTINAAFALLLICIFMIAPLTAAEGFADEYYRVADMAGLLSEAEGAALLSKLDEISLRQSFDVVVATTDTLSEMSVQDYADTLYDECHFGYGSTKDGLLLLISMEDSDWYISTCGYGLVAFTDAGIEYIGEQIRPYLSSGDFATAFTKFAELCDDFITQARSDKPYDVGNLPRTPLSPVWILISIIIGFVLAKLVVGSMKGKLKTVRAKAAADSYVKNDSMNVRDSRDRFLYHTVTRTAKSDSSSSGGSSSHTSSSGTTHGGSGGKF